MSWPALKWALLKRIPASQKSLLITLARRQPDDLRAFSEPMATLADEAGLSVGGFKIVIAALVSKGLVSVTSSGNRPHVYDLQLASASHNVASNLLASQLLASNLVNVCEPPTDSPASNLLPTNRHKKQTPKYKHSFSRSREKEKADPRFGEFVSALQTYWETANHGIAFGFTGKDGSALKALLKERSTLELKTFQTWLIHRANSEDVNHGEEFFAWLPRIAKYTAGPLNKYQQPLGGSDGNRSSQHGSTALNRGQARTDAQKNAAAGAYQDLLRGAGPNGHL